MNPLTIVKAISLLPFFLASPAYAGQWTFIEAIPGGNACAARLDGNEVDTTLMLNRSGKLVLVAGRADWSASGSQEIGLRIDGFQLEHLAATAFNNLVLLEVSDQSVLQRLKVANDLYWSLPSGKYHAEVTGLGDALSWVRQCEQAKRLSVGGT